MRKILVMIPAGEMYDHDCVRWYRAHDVQRSINHYHNIGDAFVHDSSLKLLAYDNIDVMEISKFDQKEIDKYNSEYEYCFLRGSNYINSSMNWQNTYEVVSRLKIPVISFGVGAQAPASGPLELSAESRRVLALLADHCETMGVRGIYTAEVLWDHGIRNARIIGCPTLFRHRDPQLQIDLPSLDQVRRVAFTLRREVSATYARDVQLYNSVQRRVILDLATRFDLGISAQGEIEEKKIVLGTAEQRADALADLSKSGWLQGEVDTLDQLYRERLFYADAVSAYDDYVRQFDLVLGYRLHGNLIALSNGIPSVYFTYDSRTAEFADTFKIPAFDVFQNEAFELEAFWDQARFERFNQAYARGYREMRTFLAENGIAHRLPSTRTAPEVRHAA